MSLPTLGSSESRASASVMRLSFSRALISARAARASAAFASAAERCSGVSCGGVAMQVTVPESLPGGGVRVAQLRASSPAPARARGSANVAVPTCTATAPASSSSVASHPVATPPTPTIGRSGRAAWTSCTARTATGWIAGPDSPPPPAPSAGCARRRVVGQAEQRVDAGHGLGAGSGDGAGDLDDAVGVGAQLRPPRATAPGGRREHLGRQLGVVGEDGVAALEVGAGQVDLDGDDLRRCCGEQVRGSGVVVDRAPPDRRHDGGTGVRAGRAARGPASTARQDPAGRRR